MAVNVELSVSGLSQFKSSMNDAQASVKTLDAALKANEKSMKAYGASESYIATQTGLLNQKLKEQGNIAKNAEAALKQMEANGVKPTSAAYQNMARKAIEARSAMLDTEQQIRELGESSAQAAGQADQLTDSVNAIGKKISLDQVISGINGITGALEKAGKKAVDVGKQIWDNITDSAKWADDAATMATILDMDVEDYQRYKKVFDTVGDITVSEWAKMKQKVQKAIVDPTDDQSALFDLLGISTHEIHAGKYGPVAGMAKDYEEIFWEVSRELQRRVENGSMTQGTADVYAQALFGKNFSNLKPLLALGEQGFKDALADQNVVTEDSVKKLAELNDTLIDLQGDFESLKSKVLAGLAPALTKGAEALDSLLGKLMDYLQTPEGQQALESLETAVSGLFEDLGKIDPEQVVSGFVDVFNKIIGGLEWLVNHKDDVIHALEAIVIGWGALKITGGVLNILKLLDGLQNLTGWGGSGGGNSNVTTNAEQALTGSGGTGWWTGLSNSATKVASTVGSFITMYDPTGALALTPQLIADRTTFGRELTAGASVGEAAGASWETIKASAAEGINNFTDYFTKVLPETIWGLIGVTPEKLQQTSDNMRVAADWTFNDEYTAEELMRIINGEDPAVVHPEIEVPEDAAGEISEQIGAVPVAVVPTVVGGGSGGGVFSIERGFGDGLLSRMGFHANGIWSVPWDGYPAILHRGERVMPAREVTSRNYSSNLYVESMYMNNGTDAEGLASAMAAAQRRTQAGFGS